MTDRPIIFSSPMVRELLANRKTQTRRLISTKPGRCPNLFEETWADSYVLDPGNAKWRAEHVRYAVGDRLYVREAFAWAGSMDPGLFLTRADYPSSVPAGYENIPAGSSIKWKPSIHMPRALSRLTLTATNVRVQRLQDINRDDAIEEGIVQTWGDFMGDPPEWAIRSIADHADASGSHIYDNRTSVRNFQALWEFLHGPASWGVNPWVVAVSFTVEQRNIDAVSS